MRRKQLLLLALAVLAIGTVWLLTPASAVVHGNLSTVELREIRQAVKMELAEMRARNRRPATMSIAGLKRIVGDFRCRFFEHIQDVYVGEEGTVRVLMGERPIAFDPPFRSDQPFDVSTSLPGSYSGYGHWFEVQKDSGHWRIHRAEAWTRQVWYDVGVLRTAY